MSATPAPPSAAVPTPSPATTSAPLISHRNLPLLLLQAREAVITRFRPLLNEQGLTEQQWRIIRTLLERGPMEPRELVQICQISSPSLTGILARMTDTGLVARERMPHDQRRILISLTEQSRQLSAALAPQIEAAYQQMQTQLGAEFMHQLEVLLDDLIDRLGAPEVVGE
jgi:homoprotocatechuate degradation regulator HpaR